MLFFDERHLFPGNGKLDSQGVARLSGTDDNGVVGVQGKPSLKRRNGDTAKRRKRSCGLSPHPRFSPSPFHHFVNRDFVEFTE